MELIKIFSFDVETTGTNPEVHDIHEISYIISVGDEEKVRRKLFVRPNNPHKIDPEALAICGGITKDTIMGYPNSFEAFYTILGDIEEHIDKFDPNDKFLMLGYNVDFDCDFLRVFMREHSEVDKIDFRFGSYFLWKKNQPNLDIYRSLPLYVFEYNVHLENFKLETVCRHFGVTLNNAHDSMQDLIATIELTNKFRSSLSKVSPTEEFLDYESLLDIAEEAGDDQESQLNAFAKIKEALVLRDIA